jgi:hypothetical protein
MACVVHTSNEAHEAREKTEKFRPDPRDEHRLAVDACMDRPYLNAMPSRHTTQHWVRLSIAVGLLMLASMLLLFSGDGLSVILPFLATALMWLFLLRRTPADGISPPAYGPMGCRVAWAGPKSGCPLDGLLWIGRPGTPLLEPGHAVCTWIGSALERYGAFPAWPPPVGPPWTSFFAPDR